MFIVDLKSRIPIYEQLKQSTLNMILHGILKEDDPMPSVRSLARQLGINPNTIQKSYQQMESEGIIYSLSGRGSFVKSNQPSSPQVKLIALQKLKQSAYEARLYGIDKETALSIINKTYEKGFNTENTRKDADYNDWSNCTY